MRMPDTHPEAERIQIEILRQMPVWRRIELLEGMIISGQELALGVVRGRFPNATPEEIHRRLATMMLGQELAVKVYGPEPDPPTIP